MLAYFVTTRLYYGPVSTNNITMILQYVRLILSSHGELTVQLYALIALLILDDCGKSIDND